MVATRFRSAFLAEIMVPLRERSFRMLWLAFAASTLGDRIVVIALAIFLSEREGPGAVAAVLAASTASLVVFLLLGGVFADRLPRRKVLFASDLLRASLHLALGALILLTPIGLWEIVAIEVAFSAGEAFFRPAFSGYLPQTVPPAMIQPAWAATSSVISLGDLLGPALGTLLVIGAGAGPAFLVDGALFLTSALLLRATRPRFEPEPAPRSGVVRELREGWDALRSRTWAWSSIAVFSIGAAALWGPWLTLGASTADSLYGSSEVFGLFVFAAGVGTLSATVFAASWRPRFPLRAGYLALVPGFAAVPAFAFGAPLWVGLPLAFVWGAGEASFEVCWSTLLAQWIPGNLLSRVTAFEWLGAMAFMPLGVIAANLLGSELGNPTVLLLGQGVYAASVLLGLAVRDARRIEFAPAGGDG